MQIIQSDFESEDFELLGSIDNEEHNHLVTSTASLWTSPKVK